MANKKISDFSINIHPSGENIMPIVASGQTMAITLSGLTDVIAGGFSGGKKVIGPNDNITIKDGFQFVVYGDLTLSGGTINNLGNITIINGSLINSGGTYNTSGGTLDLVGVSRDTFRLITMDVAQSGATINVVPHSTKTFVKITTTITGGTYFTCSDISNCNIGDTLIYSTIIGTGSSPSYTFDENYILSNCGNIDTPSIFEPHPPRNITIFTFDGRYWINTFDNC